MLTFTLSNETLLIIHHRSILPTYKGRQKHTNKKYQKSPNIIMSVGT